MLEVYERLKFLVRECFHASISNNILFKSATKELELYLKSYENNSEDSEFDSDEEWEAVKICKDLKGVIEQKASIISQTELVSPEVSSYDDVSSQIQTPNESIKRNAFDKKNSTELKLNKSDKEETEINENDHNLYKNVLNKKSESQQKKAQAKPGSMIIDTNFEEDFEKQKKITPQASTPGVNSGSFAKFRMPRGWYQNSSLKQRSSSIHSIKSSKGNTNKAKKKSKFNKKSINLKKNFSQRGSSSDESWASEKRSVRSRSSTHSQKSKNKFEDSKQNTKGLSSFAKNKDLRKHRHKRNKNARKKIKNKMSNAKIKPEISEPIKLTLKIENKASNKPAYLSVEKSKKHLANLPSLSQDGQDERDEKEDKTISSHLLAPVKKASLKEKREMYKTKKLKSAIHQVHDFNTIFNSFAENEFGNFGSRQPRRTLFTKGNTLNAEKLMSPTTKYAFTPKHNSTKNAFDFSLLTRNKTLKSKNRSRSLYHTTTYTSLNHYGKSTLSDFHECIRCKIDINNELYYGIKPMKRIIPKRESSSASNSLERLNDSISNNTAQEKSMNKDSSSDDESENLDELVRFYSLPILPSEKQSLEINFDDEIEVFHKTSFSKTTINDFTLLRAVSHGAYGKVCLARK